MSFDEEVHENDWLDGDPPGAPFVIPRLWPILVGTGLAYGSIFLPWLLVGRSEGSRQALVPAQSPYALTVASAVCAAVVVGGFIQWRQRGPIKPVIRLILVGLASAALTFTVLAELVASVVPSVGSLVHLGHFALSWSTGDGPWLAVVGFGAAALGISLEQISRIGNFRPGTAVRASMGVAFAVVLVGRNYSWFSIAWNGHHLGVPSWYIPVIGNDVRSCFLVWLVALLMQWRWPLVAYTAIVTATWTIVVLTVVTTTLLQRVSLRTVDHLLGPSVGKFSAHAGVGLTISMAGALFGTAVAVVGLWRAGSERRASRLSVGVGAA